MSLTKDMTEKTAFDAHTDSASDPDHHVNAANLPIEHGHLSVADVFRGTAVHESTPFELKAALINT
jgi:hypothetical protein